MAKKQEEIRVNEEPVMRPRYRVTTTPVGDLETALNELLTSGHAITQVMTTVSSPDIIIIYIETPPRALARRLPDESDN
jgi:hypothetical protein